MEARKLLVDIKDFGDLLSTDMLWDALAQQEMSQWKDAVKPPLQDSETGGRLRFSTKKFKPYPAAEGYNSSKLGCPK